MVETKESVIHSTPISVDAVQIVEAEPIHAWPKSNAPYVDIHGKVVDPQVTEAVNNTVSVDPLTERVRMLELALNYVSQQQFPQPDQTYGMLVALALKGKDKTTLKALCPTCGKTYAYQGLCRDYFHQPMPVRDVI